MDRLNLVIALLCCLALLAACGGGGTPDVQGDNCAGKLVTTSEQAVLGCKTLVDERIARALDGLALPQADELPGLPGEGWPEHLPSAAHTTTRNGADYYSDLKSENAVVDGTSMNLAAQNDDLSWAVYQFPIGAGSTLNRITVTASNGVFSGDDPGYWIGVADYLAGTWRAIALMNNTAAPYVRTFNLSSSAYLSPNNNLYVFVLVQGQEVSINSLSLDYEAVTWEHVEFGEGANNAGWTPALAFVKNAGALMILYADYNSRKARYGVWDMTGDFSAPGSWAFMDVDELRAPSAGDAFNVSGATCKWLDLTQDPATGYPRVSLVYDGAIDRTGGDTDSVVGLSVYISGATPLFLNYWLGSGVYGGGYTSVDYDSETNYYSVAHYVRNEGWVPEHDMNLRKLNVANPLSPILQPVVKNYKTLFGIPCYYPHVRCLSNHNYALSVNGGHMYELLSDSYIDYNVDAESNALGSVADSGQAKGWGYCYTKQSSGNTILRFVEDLENPGAPLHDVETVAAGGWIGTSQLAYDSDGYPGIAYTKYTGSGIDVKLAEYDGTQWAIETVSAVPCQPADTSDREAVLVDLDYNILGQPALIWSQVNGTSCKAHVALRTE